VSAPEPPDRAPGTRAVHAGLPAPAQGEPFLPGPVFAAPFHLAGDADAHRYGYHRYGNPTWSHYEAALGELEGGEAVVLPSGMAAVTATLLSVLEPGDVFVGPSDAYPGVRDVAATHLVPMGVDVRLVPTDEAALAEAVKDARLVLVEVPSNPALDVIDLRALAGAVHENGGLLAVDNTLATPLLQRPLELGADLSVASATKALTGHADVMLGHVVARSPGLVEGLRSFRGRTGSVPGPFEVWLAHRSLATLDVRLARQCANALALAEALSAHRLVSDVRYPGLPSHPGHALAARQMGGRFGPVLGFTLPGADVAQRFLGACSLVAEATSFGGVHSSAERRARWGTDAIAEGWIRLSAGLEDARDLVADVLGALEVAAGSSVGTT
jgi:cystathionine gamma-lyase